MTNFHWAIFFKEPDYCFHPCGTWWCCEAGAFRVPCAEGNYRFGWKWAAGHEPLPARIYDILSAIKRLIPRMFFLSLTPGLALSSVLLPSQRFWRTQRSTKFESNTRPISIFISTLRFALLRVRLMWSAAENYTALYIYALETPVFLHRGSDCATPQQMKLNCLQRERFLGGWRWKKSIVEFFFTRKQVLFCWWCLNFDCVFLVIAQLLFLL